MFSKNTILAVVILFFGADNLVAQVRCQASAPSQVAVGQTFGVKYELNETPSSYPTFNLSNFTVMGAPSTQAHQQISIINGRPSVSNSFICTYYFTAQKEGIFTIPAAAFVVDGKEVKSNPVTIKVVSANANPARKGQPNNPAAGGAQTPPISKDDYFIKASVSNANPYVGEQVIVHYKLYLHEQTMGYRYQPTDFPTAKGCWKYELSQWQSNPKRNEQIVNGKRYFCLDLSSIAIYPQQSGVHVLSPLAMDLTVQVPVRMQQQDDIFDMFFNMSPFSTGNRAFDLKVSSPSVSITAKETPAHGKPNSYSGMVGNFKLSAKLREEKATVGEATSLIVTISGNGNLQCVEPPQLDFPNAFDAHKPEITDNIKTSLSGVSGSRTFEYIFVPRAEGEFVIPTVHFSYFDKSKNSYVTLNSSDFRLTVVKGSGSDIAYTSSRTDVQRLATDIRYIHTAIAAPFWNEDFFLSSFFWALLITPFLVLIVVIILFYRMGKARQNVVLSRDRKAAKLARKRLSLASRFLKMGKQDEFYVEISRVLWGYVSDKFHIPLLQLSFDTAEEKLSSRNMNPNAIETFLSTLKECEYVRFSSQPHITPEQMYQEAFTFITQIEKELKG